MTGIFLKNIFGLYDAEISTNCRSIPSIIVAINSCHLWGNQSYKCFVSRDTQIQYEGFKKNLCSFTDYFNKVMCCHIFYKEKHLCFTQQELLLTVNHEMIVW